MMITKDGMPAKLTGTHLLLAAGRKANVEGLVRFPGMDRPGGFIILRLVHVLQPPRTPRHTTPAMALSPSGCRK